VIVPLFSLTAARTAALTAALALPVSGPQVSAPPASGPSTQGAAKPAAPAPSFDELARQAAQARESNRVDEAIALYRRAVGLRPRWDEGWWYLGTLLYDKDRFADARPPLRRFAALKPEMGPGWALLGLCDFRMGDYASAVSHVEKGLQLGLSGNDELHRVTVYHQALLYLKGGQFERAVGPLTLLARKEPESAKLVDATGLLLLRMALLPSEVPEAKRDLVRRVGHAGYLSLARKGDEAATAYAALVEAYPKEPDVHYAYGVFLLSNDADRALAEFRREIEINPGNVYAHLEIAFELLRRLDNEGAKPAAEEAVRLAPRLFAAHNALGRALVELGELERGLSELERAAELAPETPQMYFSLARGYAKAGRTEDAARARKKFAELEQKRRERAGGEPARPEEGGSPRRP
jgi:tetratricopeptide (TPR) repeat protein